jgi:excisionase family DNA binding protein
MSKKQEILTIEELSEYLKIPRSTLYKLCQEGRIPSQKVGRHWRFRKQTIDQWLDEKSLKSDD